MEKGLNDADGNFYANVNEVLQGCFPIQVPSDFSGKNSFYFNVFLGKQNITEIVLRSDKEQF